MPGPRTLILMRHATAGHQGASTDHDRPLTAEGVREAAGAGDWIRQELPPVDAVLSSTAVRTRQTVTATRIDAPATFAEQLYGGGIDDILEQIARLPDTAGTVLVVGHAPGIPATAAELVTIAALARAGNPATEADDPAAATDAEPGIDGLRHFSAGALAVLTTGVPWGELADHGADLTTVRHPGR
jgi:phosphohistidine phosphatase